VNTKQYKLLQEVNQNVLAIGNFLIESLTPKKKKAEVAPRVKRKKTLADMVVKVLSEAEQPIEYTQLRNVLRVHPVPFNNTIFSPTLRKLLKKGDIKIKKSGRFHMYSIAKRAA